MSFITALKKYYSGGNPIEINYDIEAGYSNRIKIEIWYDNNVIYSGIYNGDIDRNVFTDIQPILQGLSNNKLFDIETSTFNTTLSNVKTILVSIYVESSNVWTNFGIYTPINILPQSLSTDNWLKYYNSKPYGDYEKAKLFKNGNNMLHFASCQASWQTMPIETLPSGLIYSSNGFTIEYSYNATKFICNDTNNQYYTNIDVSKENFKLGDVIYLHLQLNYPINVSNLEGDMIRFYIAESDEITMAFKQYLFYPTPIDTWYEYTVTLTITKNNLKSLIFIIGSVQRLNMWFKVSDIYLGTLPSNPYTSHVEDVTAIGQSSTRNSYNSDAEYIIQDKLLNNLNQYYTRNNLDHTITYDKYFKNKTIKKSLRYAPINLQVLSTPSFYDVAEYVVTSTRLFTFQDGFNTLSDTFEGVEQGWLIKNNISNININPLRFLEPQMDILDTHNYIIFSLQTFPAGSTERVREVYGRNLFFQIMDTTCYKGKVYQIYWENTRGGIDWLIMGGKNIKSLQNKKEVYKTNWRTGGSVIIGGKNSTIVNNIFNTTIDTTFSLNSDILEEYEYNNLEDLVSSPKIWIWDAQTKETFSVDMVDNNFTYKNFNNDKVFNFSCVVKKQLINKRNQF